MRTKLPRHVRLYSSLIAGAMLFFVLPAQWPDVSRVLVAWNGGVVMFLALIYFWMPSLTARQLCDKYIEEDAAAPIILVGVIVAAALSLVAIVALLSGIKELRGVERSAHFVLSALTVVTSWTLV